MSRKFSQLNETDPLKTVIIGRWDGYNEVKEYSEIINEEQKKGSPSIEQLEYEFGELQRVLEENNIEVIVPEFVGKFVFDQLTPRDIAVVINNKLILCNMANKSRRYEAAGIFPFLKEFTGDEPNILIPPAECLLEGGDIIVDKGRLLVGISMRTNLKAYEWLQEIFGDELEVVPIYIPDKEREENLLHLDLVFNPVGENFALIYEEGLKPVPDFIKSDYDLIKVEKEEQRALAVNCFSISQKKVINRDHQNCRRVTHILREKGIDVEEIEFEEAPLTGGSFRCCTLPLIRVSD